MKGKILYDQVCWIGNSYMEGLIEPGQGTLPGDLIDTSYTKLYSHYFLIINGDKRRIERIKQGILLGLEQIAEQTTLGKAKNCEMFRVSTPRRVELDKDEIFYGEWERNPALHERSLVARQTLIEKASSGEL